MRGSLNSNISVTNKGGYLVVNMPQDLLFDTDSAALRPALMDVVAVVTAFTVAHSITLGLAIFGVLTPPAVFIETVIALSVVLAALNNLLGGFSLKRWRLALPWPKQEAKLELLEIVR